MIRIFLADSEIHIRRALKLLLAQDSQFEIVGEASHVESLLAQVCSQPPDAIILDWNLVGLHPQRLLNTLRDHCPATRILATSVRPEQMAAVFEIGADGFLLKQLPPDQFYEALIKALDKSSTHQLFKEIS